MADETKLDVWMQLAIPVYPTLTEDRIKGLSLIAANEWFLGLDSELANLYDQYVMLKTLKNIGINNGN